MQRGIVVARKSGLDQAVSASTRSGQSLDPALTPRPSHDRADHARHPSRVANPDAWAALQPLRPHRSHPRSVSRRRLVCKEVLLQHIGQAGYSDAEEPDSAGSIDSPEEGSGDRADDIRAICRIAERA